MVLLSPDVSGVEVQRLVPRTNLLCPRSIVLREHQRPPSAVEDEADIDKLLQANRRLVTEQFVAMLEQAQVGMQGDEEAPPGAAERLSLVLAKARALLG